MPAIPRAAGPVVVLALACGSLATAATPREIENAIQNGANFLKSRYEKGNGAAGAGPNGADYGIGPTCLAGLAQLEAGRPVTDPAVKNIINLVREAAYSQNKTYQ